MADERIASEDVIALRDAVEKEHAASLVLGALMWRLNVQHEIRTGQSIDAFGYIIRPKT